MKVRIGGYSASMLQIAVAVALASYSGLCVVDVWKTLERWSRETEDGQGMACLPAYGCGKNNDSCQLVRLLHVFLHLFTGECISGFGPVVAQGTLIDQRLQVIVQSFQFNDSGRITAFHLAGTCGGGEEGVGPSAYIGTVQDCINILQVWRPSGGDGFSIATNFTATLAVTYNTAVTTSVAVDEPIPFSSGDVLGFTPGPGFFFAIYMATTPNQQQASHTFYTFNSFATELSTAGNRVVASPIISVEGKHVTHYGANPRVQMATEAKPRLIYISIFWHAINQQYHVLKYDRVMRLTLGCNMYS